MTAGTVISGGFPGRVAQEVQPNQKCSGCLHYADHAGRTGACTIGLRPWLCGDGQAQDIGYAPIARGAGTYLHDMTAHVARPGHEIDPQASSALHGVGSTRPVQFKQVSLGEEHVHIVKSIVTQHKAMQESMCRLCKSRGAIGMAPANVAVQVCTCEPIEARTVAKSLMSQLSNRERSRVTLDEATQFVYDVAEAGFELPVEKAIDHEKHSHIVTGPYAEGGRGYSSAHTAQAAADKLDNKYGAYRHQVSKNPKYNPPKSPTNDWKQKYPRGAVAKFKSTDPQNRG